MKIVMLRARKYLQGSEAAGPRSDPNRQVYVGLV